MPLYEYRCSECGQVSEFRMKMSDPNPEVCPSCGSSSPLSKLISQTAFHLKGGGWYSEGYTGPSNKKAESTSETTKKDDKKTT